MDAAGKKVWSRELDIYRKTRTETGHSNFVPFLYQEQYFDEETGLAYNRFRYYSSDSGTYLSQDPIGLAGGANFYAYVKDTNTWVNVFEWQDIWFRALSQSDMSNLSTGKYDGRRLSR